MKEETKKIGYAITVAVVFTLLAASIAIRYGLVAKTGPQNVTFKKMLMGTVVELTLRDDGQDLDKAAQAGFAEIERLEPVFSNYIKESETTRISLNAGKLVNISPDTIAVLKKALMVAEVSKGAFDPTIGALAKVWGPSGEKGVVPSEAEVKKLLLLVDWKKIIVDETGGKAGLAEKGMSINLGGVAKGYIAWKAAEAVKADGIRRCIIKAGGDMYVFQDMADNPKPFIIGIQHPRSKALLGEVYVDSGAISTSGDYERFFEKAGVRYHHILDPKTGFPARKSMSVTIVSKDPTLGDALSTAVFVMGPVDGMALIERLDNVEGVIVDANGKVTASSGFKGKIF
ncbi:MAG: FAD:protein FMN transferase [Deltaproteobacteria bacterium]|nr:FAD:protein FMN transferase [Deltaproteobacteria bacterium]